jgi:hypothetical protein
VPQRSTPAARPFGRGAVEQAHMLQRSIGNQATLRLLAERATSLTENEPHGHNGREAEGLAREAPVASWDFSKVPVFPPNRPNGRQAGPPLTAPPETRIIQPKLAVGRIDDPLEQEADRVADQVMRTPRANPAGSAVPPGGQRMCHACMEELRAKAVPGEMAQGPEDFEQRFASLRGGGERLSLSERAFFEPRFGRDFSRVQLHSGPAASELARSVQARAFTLGDSIVFGAGQYAPGQQVGRRLLAHELTHVVQQGGTTPAAVSAIQREPDESARTGRDAAIEGLDKWELACNRAISRYRDLLTHNLILFLADVLTSGKGSAAIDKIKGGFIQNATEQALGNLVAMGGVVIGAHAGGRAFAKLFLAARTGKVLGGFVSFIIGAIIEAVVGDLLDKSNEIIQATASQVDQLVTKVVNPAVNSKQQEFTRETQTLRSGFLSSGLTVQELSQATAEINSAIVQIESAFTDTNDEYLYRQLALAADVYSRRIAPAENKPPVSVPGDGNDIEFKMQHRLVKTGRTAISVVRDGATVVIRCRAEDCIEDEGVFSPAWMALPPPRNYYLQLYQGGFFSDTDIGVPREFHVEKEEYGVWYNLKRGTYHLMAWRVDDHPVAVCAEGKYWIAPGSEHMGSA